MSICRECVLENAQRFYDQYNYGYDVIHSCTLNDEGQHHSFNDRPSMVLKSGVGLSWHKNGKKHRENGPASIRHGVGFYYYYGDHAITTYKDLYVRKTYEWNENSIALVVEKISDTFYRVMVGDEKFLVASVSVIKD